LDFSPPEYETSKRELGSNGLSFFGVEAFGISTPQENKNESAIGSRANPLKIPSEY
jgi:hypothetical protein